MLRIPLPQRPLHRRKLKHGAMASRRRLPECDGPPRGRRTADTPVCVYRAQSCARSSRKISRAGLPAVRRRCPPPSDLRPLIADLWLLTSSSRLRNSTLSKRWKTWHTRLPEIGNFVRCPRFSVSLLCGRLSQDAGRSTDHRSAPKKSRSMTGAPINSALYKRRKQWHMHLQSWRHRMTTYAPIRGRTRTTIPATISMIPTIFIKTNASIGNIALKLWRDNRSSFSTG